MRCEAIMERPASRGIRVLRLPIADQKGSAMRREARLGCPTLIWENGQLRSRHFMLITTKIFLVDHNARGSGMYSEYARAWKGSLSANALRA